MEWALFRSKSIFALTVCLLDILDIDLNELCQRYRERGLLQRVVPLEELKESLKVHGKCLGKVLYQLVSISDIDEIETLIIGNRLRVGLVRILLIRLLLNDNEGPLKDIFLCFKS